MPRINYRGTLDMQNRNIPIAYGNNCQVQGTTTTLFTFSLLTPCHSTDYLLTTRLLNRVPVPARRLLGVAPCVPYLLCARSSCSSALPSPRLRRQMKSKLRFL